jgi:hypothetical protein
MRVGLAPAAVPTINPNRLQISVSYANLSRFSFPTKAPGRRLSSLTIGALIRLPAYISISVFGLGRLHKRLLGRNFNTGTGRLQDKADPLGIASSAVLVVC